MTVRRLSRLQRGILAWHWAEDRHTRGIMRASYQDWGGP
jgi:hypothetical protein